MKECNALFIVQQNDDEDGASTKGGGNSLVSIPNPLYSGYRAFAEPFGVNIKKLCACNFNNLQLFDHFYWSNTSVDELSLSIFVCFRIQPLQTHPISSTSTDSSVDLLSLCLPAISQLLQTTWLEEVSTTLFYMVEPKNKRP